MNVSNWSFNNQP